MALPSFNCGVPNTRGCVRPPLKAASRTRKRVGGLMGPKSRHQFCSYHELQINAVDVRAYEARVLQPHRCRSSTQEVHPKEHSTCMIGTMARKGRFIKASPRLPCVLCCPFFVRCIPLCKTSRKSVTFTAFLNKSAKL